MTDFDNLVVKDMLQLTTIYLYSRISIIWSQWARGIISNNAWFRIIQIQVEDEKIWDYTFALGVHSIAK